VAIKALRRFPELVLDGKGEQLRVLEDLIKKTEEKAVDDKWSITTKSFLENYERMKDKRGDKVLFVMDGSEFYTGGRYYLWMMAQALYDVGYDVHILTRKTSNKWRLTDVLPKVNNHVGDLTDFDKLKKIVEEINPEIIFHLATASIFGGKHLPERDLITVNFVGTFNLMNACNNIDYKCFINTGSSSEYGPKNMPMKEDDVCEPVNMYGVTKLASSLYGKVAAKLNNKPIVTLRLFSPFGPYDDPSRLITYTILNALEGKDLKLANPDAVRDYIYVEDVIQSYMYAISRMNSLKGEVLNVGLGKETKISYAVEKIIEFTDSRSKVFWNKVTPRSFDTDHWEADMNKSKKILKINAQTEFEEGLKKTIGWFKENINLYRTR